MGLVMADAVALPRLAEMPAYAVDFADKDDGLSWHLMRVPYEDRKPLWALPILKLLNRLGVTVTRSWQYMNFYSSQELAQAHRERHKRQKGAHKWDRWFIFPTRKDEPMDLERLRPQNVPDVECKIVVLDESELEQILQMAEGVSGELRRILSIAESG